MTNTPMDPEAVTGEEAAPDVAGVAGVAGVADAADVAGAADAADAAGADAAGAADAAAGQEATAAPQASPTADAASATPAPSAPAKRKATRVPAAARRTAATRAAAAQRAVVMAPATAKRTAATKAAGATKAAAATKAAKAAASPAIAGAPPRPTTLAIDIGGTGLKASVLDLEGRILADRVRIPTTYPMPPELMVETIGKLIEPLPKADRASVGFPGVVRNGHVLTAPHFVTKSGPGTKVVRELVGKWTGFDLEGALEQRLGIPVRVANDADLQGWAVVSGHGLEMVITLGTGVGSALFVDGRLAPHLELAHHPFRKGQTYNDQLGEAALTKMGRDRWRKRVKEAVTNFSLLVNYDRLYIGGGNARIMTGHVDPSIAIVDNVAGILGGIKLWEHGWH